ncbi:MAG: phosphoribosyltransferase family protein [Kiritimatiellae bacterium]|nr:phosphoribosyltransferase family protein [Kiritimatiellia bacterium]
MNSQAMALDLCPSESVLDGWMHSFGVYYPRWNAIRHQNSPWSKAVIMAKRKHESVIERFGMIIASHLYPLLKPREDYIITPVPGEQERERCLFQGLERCVTEILADCIHIGLRGNDSVTVENLLVQVKPKAKRQHQCLNIAERMVNVRNIYAVMNRGRVYGKNIILVDDVITSGATMAECARILRESGASAVMGVALARTVRLNQPEVSHADAMGDSGL